MNRLLPMNHSAILLLETGATKESERSLIRGLYVRINCGHICSSKQLFGSHSDDRVAITLSPEFRSKANRQLRTRAVKLVSDLTDQNVLWVCREIEHCVWIRKFGAEPVLVMFPRDEFR